MSQPTVPGRDLFLTSNRLRHHLLEWGEGRDVVLLLHGFLEHAHTWDFVAPRLAEAGLHVYALDWRGHGDSEWIGAGGYYHFVDYIADLAGIVRQLGEQVALVGHSMGGGAAILHAGTEPTRVRGLVSIEGLGVPEIDPATAPERYSSWIEDLARVAKRERRLFTIADARRRIGERFPSFSEEVVEHMALHGTRAREGLRDWKFDPMHQTQAPLPTPVAQARAFWARVQGPVLYVDGSKSNLRLSDEDIRERLTALRARREVIAGAAHHPHLEAAEALSATLLKFLRSTGAGGT